ncbi:hypothetical protein BDZ89DRAFT_1150908 [Hymenopellis radicata]|nr:hypothetical protein BDZ89DRAFT_1150908 [Hymenopellis radicata]
MKKRKAPHLGVWTDDGGLYGGGNPVGQPSLLDVAFFGADVWRPDTGVTALALFHVAASLSTLDGHSNSADVDTLGCSRLSRDDLATIPELHTLRRVSVLMLFDLEDSPGSAPANNSTGSVPANDSNGPSLAEVQDKDDVSSTTLWDLSIEEGVMANTLNFRAYCIGVDFRYVSAWHVSWSALNLYFKALGGNHVWLFFLFYIGGLVLTQLLSTVQTWWLGYWASQYEGADEAYVPVAYCIAVYSALALVAVMVDHLDILWRCHSRVEDHSSKACGFDPWDYFETVILSLPSLRATVDGPVAMWFLFVVDLTVMLLVKFLAIVTVTPLFVVPAVFVFVAGGICGQIYIKAQLSVKREMSNAQAPVLSNFGAAITGLTSIRAYGVQAAFIEESLKRINTFSRASRTYYNLNRWICRRIDAFGSLFAAALATYLVYFQDQAAVTTGFSLNMASAWLQRIDPVVEPVVLVGSLEGSFMASFLLGWGVTVSAGLTSYPLDTIHLRMMMTSGSGVNYKSITSRQPNDYETMCGPGGQFEGL